MDRQALSAKNLASNWVHYGLREPVFTGTLPDIMQVETTSLCNLSCVFCPHDQMTRRRGFLDLGLVDALLPELDHVASLGLHHMGEPLLHPQIAEIIARFENAGISTTISTNGTLLGPELGQRLISAGLSRLIISLDGFRDETYTRLRRGGRLEQVMANLDRFLDLKTRSTTGRPFVQVKMILTPEASSEVDDFIGRWVHRAGVDQIVLNDERTWAGARIRHEGYVSRPGYRLPCRYLWESLVVLWDGRVVPCCKDYDGVYVVGNLAEGDHISDIWQNDMMVSLRKAHVDGHQGDIPLCAKCGEWPGHEAMNPTDSIKALESFRARKRESRRMRIHKKDFE